MSDLIIGVDLGGTRIRAALCDKDLNIIKREETLTLADEGLDPVLQRIKDLIHDVMPEDETTVKGIGISAPGPLNPETGIIVSPPNLPGWHNVPLGDVLKAEFPSCEVYVGNDANVAALAETMKGAGRGYTDVIYITVSTGIGSGMIIDGRMLLGVNGLGAEIGHIPLVVDGGKVSSLEEEAAGPDMALKAVRRIEAGEKSAISDLVNGDLSKVNGSTVGKAAVAGDELALSVVSECGLILGLGMVTVLHLFNPQILIIGGGVTDGLGDLLLKPMEEAIKKHTIDEAYWKNLKIVTPDLAEDVSIYGSAALVALDGGIRRIDTLEN
jgi:glucokinase